MPKQCAGLECDHCILPGAAEAVMHDMWTQVGRHLIARVSGPMKFRFVLQPLMASVFAIRSGLADAKRGNRRMVGPFSGNPGTVLTCSRTAGKASGSYSFSWCCWTLCTKSLFYALYIQGNSHRSLPPGDRALPAHTRTGQPSGSKEKADDNSVGQHTAAG